jgi:hypothetical protein
LLRTLQKYTIALLTPLIFFIFSHCTPGDGEPSYLIDQDKMADIMAVIYVSEEKAARHYEIRLQKNEYMKDYLYPAIFDSLQVTDSIFYRSYEWYESRPALFEVLMDSVTARIERMPLDTAAGPEEESPSLDKIYRDLQRNESVGSGGPE